MRIGIDLGGTKTEVIALGDAGEQLYRHRLPTPRDDYRQTIETIATLVDMAEQATGQRGTVGMGIPGSISPYTGVVKNANSTWLNGQPFDKDLSARLQREVRLANDANCLAVSEAVDGAAAGAQTVFAVIIGTGCGAGVAFNGRAHIGGNGTAGEWGHNPLPWMDEDELRYREEVPCYCGKQGCIETFISGTGFATDYRRLSGHALKGSEIIRLVEESDPVAELALRRYELRLAKSLAHVVNILDPDVIVLGGGMSNVDRLYQTVPQLIKQFVFGGECETPVRKAKHGDSSGVRGAAWLHINNTVMSVGYEIAKILNSKVVWHLRGFMDLDFGWMPLRGWDKYINTLKQTDAVIGITKTVLEHYVSLESKNAYVISDAVRSKDDTCLVRPKEKYFLFCAGFLTEQKGCAYAISAFAKSGLATKGYKLKIIGEAHSKYMSQLTKIVANAGISDAVEFLGRSDKVKEYMSRAIAFLMCSENEGLGRVSIEAMFYGCLVIGRNSGGTKDFVFDGKTGLLFNDMDGCVSAMQKAAETDHQEIIRYARQFARENFSIENYGEKILNVYEKVLDRVIKKLVGI